MSARSEQGFTLIETIIGMTIMIMMVMAISELFVSNLTSLALAKTRAAGLGLANQQMEYIRNLPYNSVATQNGTIYPPGNIPDSKDASFDGRTYTVRTIIGYVDDPFDGNATGTISGKPKDVAPMDYKRATVIVLVKSSGKQVAQLTTDISSGAAETNEGTGVLSVSVINSSGQPVSGAAVQITNTTLSPAVNIAATTDDSGIIMVPNLPPDTYGNYYVVASMPGYSTEQTIPEPSGAQTAVNPNPSILAQQVTPVTLAIDKVSDMTVQVKDATGVALAGETITITGGKKIKLNPNVYKYSQTLTSDAAGQIVLNDIEWDSYSFVPQSGYYLLTASPYAPVVLGAGTNQTVVLTLGTSSLTPRISGVAPVSQSTGTSGSITVTGVNLISGSTIVLKKSGSANITATSVVSSNGSKKLTANLSLSGAVIGAWDIEITNTRGSVTQPGGFNVVP